MRSAATSPYGFFDSAAPRWSSVAAGTTADRSNSMNVSRIGRDGDERHVGVGPGCGVDRLCPDLQRDRSDQTTTVGLEDLMHRSQRDLMNSTGVAVLACLLRQRSRRDFVGRLGVLVRFDVGHLVGAGDQSLQPQFGGSGVEGEFVLDGEVIGVHRIR